MADNNLIAGRFEKFEEIGAGAMGAVFKGRDTQTDEFVAIKALKPDVIKQDPQIIERFEREGEALRRLNHPSIVKVIATAQEEKDHFLVLEFVDGGSLREVLDKTPQLPIKQILDIALDLSDALARAHRLDIVHRDIKPANVLIAKDGTPRLTDFGIARIGDTSQMTQKGVIMGTLAYLPPEALSGQRTDFRGDIWAFGVMLYEMCTGRRPFDGDNTGAILNGTLNEEPPDMLQLRDYEDFGSWGLPGLIYWMLEKDREKRPQSARLIGAMVENLMSGSELPSLNWFGDSTGQYDEPIKPATAAQAVRQYTTSGFTLSEINAELTKVDSTTVPEKSTTIGLDSQWTADPTISRSDWSLKVKRKIDHTPRIFISYRRADSTAITGRIHDRLEMAFGDENVFKDVTDIPAGADYKQVIEHEIRSSDVMLVMIGDKWLNAANEKGRRLEDPDDVVRFEVETGLDNETTLVIPVLVSNATMPEDRLLPPKMKSLTSYNAAPIRNDPDFNRDVEWLVNQIANAFEFEQRERRLSWQSIAIASGFVLILILAIALIWLVVNESNDTGNPTPVAAVATIPLTVMPTACNIEPVVAGEFMILVAEAEFIMGTERDVQRFIVDDLREHFEEAVPNSRYRIRASETVIRDDDEARQLADLCDALVIIWGNYDDERVEMNVQLGDLSAYPSEAVFTEAETRVLSDARYHMANERQETLAFSVISSINMGWTVTNEGYNLAEALTIAELISTTPAEIIGNTTGARYHAYARDYIDDTASAVAFLDTAILTNGGNPLLYIARSLGYQRLGEIEAAREDIATARNLAPDNWVSPDFMLANDFVYFQNDLEGALPYVTAALELRPDDWFLNMYRGNIYYLLRDYDAARPDIERSLALNPPANMPYLAAMGLAMRRADFIAAQNYLETVQTQFPDPSFTERILIVTLNEEAAAAPIVSGISGFGNLSLGRWNDVIQNANQALESGFEHPNFYFLLGFAQCNLEDYVAAEESYTLGIELEPDYYLLYLLRAEVRFRQGLTRSLDALADFQVIIQSPQADAYLPFTSREISLMNEISCQDFMSLDYAAFGFRPQGNDE